MMAWSSTWLRKKQMKLSSSHLIWDTTHHTKVMDKRVEPTSLDPRTILLIQAGIPSLEMKCTHMSAKSRPRWPFTLEGTLFSMRVLSYEWDWSMTLQSWSGKSILEVFLSATKAKKSQSTLGASTLTTTKLSTLILMDSKCKRESSTTDLLGTSTQLRTSQPISTLLVLQLQSRIHRSNCKWQSWTVGLKEDHLWDREELKLCKIEECTMMMIKVWENL